MRSRSALDVNSPSTSTFTKESLIAYLPRSYMHRWAPHIFLKRSLNAIYRISIADTPSIDLVESAYRQAFPIAGPRLSIGEIVNIALYKHSNDPSKYSARSLTRVLKSGAEASSGSVINSSIASRDTVTLNGWQCLMTSSLCRVCQDTSEGFPRQHHVKFCELRRF